MGEGAQAFGDGILTPTGLALLGHLPQRGGEASGAAESLAPPPGELAARRAG